MNWKVYTTVLSNDTPFVHRYDLCVPHAPGKNNFTAHLLYTPVLVKQGIILAPVSNLC